MSEYTIPQLEQMLRAAKQREMDELRASRESVTMIETYSMYPSTKPFDRSMDPSVTFWTIEKTIVNKDDLMIAGYTSSELTTGSMTYMFNGASGRFIGSTGGGHIYVSSGDRTWGEKIPDGEIERVWAELAALVIADHKATHDITDIVKTHNKNIGRD